MRESLCGCDLEFQFVCVFFLDTRSYLRYAFKLFLFLVMRIKNASSLPEILPLFYTKPRYNFFWKQRLMLFIVLNPVEV